MSIMIVESSDKKWLLGVEQTRTNNALLRSEMQSDQSLSCEMAFHGQALFSARCNRLQTLKKNSFWETWIFIRVRRCKINVSNNKKNKKLNSHTLEKGWRDGPIIPLRSSLGPSSHHDDGGMMAHFSSQGKGKVLGNSPQTLTLGGSQQATLPTVTTHPNIRRAQLRAGSGPWGTLIAAVSSSACQRIHCIHNIHSSHLLFWLKNTEKEAKGQFVSYIDMPPNEGDWSFVQFDMCSIVKSPFTVHSIFTGSRGSEGFSVDLSYLLVLGNGKFQFHSLVRSHFAMYHYK